MFAGDVIARFTADISGYTRGLQTMKAETGIWGASTGALIGGVGLALVAGAALAGVAAVKMAGDFQQGLTRLVTGAGDVTDNMTKMGQSILGISVTTGASAASLEAAMYLIVSSGQRGAQALDTLSVAAKGAVIEQASVSDVANVLSGVMTNYGTKVFGATDFMNGLIRAVQLGKITLQQLAVAMGPIDPIAKSVGVSFSDLAAAMTTQTNAMIPADRAATGLRFMMLALENPTKKARDAMTSLGLSSVAVANEMKVSLPGALQMIYEAAKKAGPEGSVPFNRAIADMVGGIRSFTAYTALTGPHMRDFVRNAQDIAAAMHHGAAGVLGWADVQNNLNFTLARGKAAISALLITVGTALLPAVTQTIGVVAQAVLGFTAWEAETHTIANAFLAVGGAIGGVISAGASIIAFFKNSEIATVALGVVLATLATFLLASLAPAITTFVGVAGFVLVDSFIAWATAAGAAAIATIAATWPILAIVAAVAALAAGFVLAYNHSAAFRAAIDSVVATVKQFWQTLQGVWSWLVGVFTPIFTIIAGVIRAQLLPVFASVASAIQTALIPAGQALAQAWSVLGPALASLWTALQPLLPALKILGEIILGVVVVGLVVFLAAIVGVVQGLAMMLPGVVQVFTGIVQIISGAISIAVGIIALAVDLMRGDWTKAGQDVTNIWNGIATFFTGIWNVIAGVFNAAFGLIVGLVSGFANTITGIFQGLSSTLVGHSIIPDMINAIVAAFTSLPGRVIGVIVGLVSQVVAAFNTLRDQSVASVTALVSQGVAQFNTLHAQVVSAVSSLTTSAIAGFNNFRAQASSAIASLVSSAVSQFNSMRASVISAISSLVSSAIGQFNSLRSQVLSVISSLASSLYQSGLNMIQQLASGISAGIGAAVSAASSVAQAVANVLHHSTPSEGPLKGDDQWGGELVKNFTTGIKAGASSAGQAAVAVATSVEDYLGFHSPTRKGPGAGADKWAPQLIALLNQGLLNGMPAVKATVEQIAGIISSVGTHPTKKAEAQSDQQIASLVTSVLPQVSNLLTTTTGQLGNHLSTHSTKVGSHLTTHHTAIGHHTTTHHTKVGNHLTTHHTTLGQHLTTHHNTIGHHLSKHAAAMAAMTQHRPDTGTRFAAVSIPSSYNDSGTAAQNSAVTGTSAGASSGTSSSGGGNSSVIVIPQGQPQTINLYLELDGMLMAQILGEPLANVIRVRLGLKV